MSGAAGDAGGASDDDFTRIVLVPNGTGWIEQDSSAATYAGVRGPWFVYGDQYGIGQFDAPCIKVGLHMPTECAYIFSPDPPPAMGFPNTNGAMHMTGTVETILPCNTGVTTAGCPSQDLANMTGAGMGVTLNKEPGPPDGTGAVHPWDPSDWDIAGIEFTLDTVPLASLRVELPMLLTADEAANDLPPLPNGSTTERHSVGSPYWVTPGNPTLHTSPVHAGVNRVLWKDVASPNASFYTFDPARILGIRFHVPAGTSSSFDLTISTLTLLRR